MELGEFPALRSLDAAQLETLRSASEEIDAAVGTELIARGDTGGAMYMLLEGELQVYVSEAAREVVLVDLHAPAVVGELELLTGRRRSASVRVIRAAKLLAIPHERVRERIESGDPATLKVMYAISQLIASRLANLTDMFVEIETNASPARSDELRAFRSKLFNDWSFETS